MNWSMQLYSARHIPLAQAIAQTAAAGYASVEAYRDNFNDPSAFQSLLNAHALPLTSMHVNLELLREDPAAWQKIARDFQCEHIVCPYLQEEQRPVDVAGWRAFAAEMEDHAKRWHDAGFRFAWHNHDFECTALADGSLPMQIMMEETAELGWEIDVAWVVRAGSSPADWVRQWGPRLTAVHVKDIAPIGDCQNEDGWADLGEGVVAWSTLMPSLLESSASQYVMEHDNPADFQRFATRSIRAAQRMVG